VCALNKWLREGRDFIGALEAENYAVADAHHSLSEALIYFHGRAGEIELAAEVFGALRATIGPGKAPLPSAWAELVAAYGAFQRSAARCNEVQCVATWHNALQHRSQPAAP
jgi:hypothetical protein